MNKQRQEKSLPSFLISISPEQLQAFFKQIQEGENKLSGKDILHIFSTQIFYFKDNQPLFKLFQTFLGLTPENDQLKIQNNIIEKFDEFLKTKQISPFFNLFKLVVNQFFNQDEIQLKFKNKLLKQQIISNNSNSAISIKDLSNNGDFNSAYKFYLDEKCHFYFQKTYSNIDQELINKEVEIYHTDFSNEQYPSFIVHTDLPLDKNKIFLPYLPYQTLKIFLNEKHNKLTPIDKFVIIKEIGLGLKELHDHLIFHQNLNSSYIMINNDQDSYISNFVFDLKQESNQSKLVPSFYYRHPDLIQKHHSFIKITEIKDDEENNIERYTKYDIYSYGILIHEILTTEQIEKLFDVFPQESREENLKKGYDYIFKSQKEKYDSKYGIKGICEIVEKCININKPYSSMKEVLNDLDKLSIHQEDEYQIEIENRIKRSTNINTYECTLSDLIVNYYLGNNFSQELIESLISKVAPNESKNDNDELILKIIKFLELEGFDIMLARVILMIKDPIKMKRIFSPYEDANINGRYFIDFYDKLFLYLENFTDNIPLIKAYRDFSKLYSNIYYTQIQSIIANKIDGFLKNKQYSHIFDLFKLIINHLFNQDEIQLKFKNKLLKHQLINNNSNSIISIKDLSNTGDFNSSYKFCFDEKCHFYFQKIYNSIDKELINKEVEIYHTYFSNEQYPSFIVHTDLPLDKNKIFLSYLPYQTLKIFLNEKHNKLTPIDKFVIIKEIGLGLKELHDHLIFHQNLNSSYIMINNDQDSYISNFVFDLKQESIQTKLVPSFYYRHPDLIQKAHSFIKITEIEDDEENNIERYTKYDIYSYGILIHEILTTEQIEKLFGNMPRQSRINLLSKGYKNILFSESKKEEYDSKYGIKGICDIIEKCVDIDDSYSSMKEVLNDLDELPIHQEEASQIEIENRIKRSINITTYECTLSDLIVNYYSGNNFSQELIESLILKVVPNEFQNNNEDLISKSLNFLGYKNDISNYEDNDIIYEEKFNNIIQQNLNRIIKQNNTILRSAQSKLLSLSISINNNPHFTISDLINTKNSSPTMNCMTNLIPITSLYNFHQQFKEKEKPLIWIYSIAKEISLIHSLNLYHRELSEKSIGIYYNYKEQTFLPLVIPFYIFYKNSQNKTSNQTIIYDEDIEKNMQKDIKKFLRIVEKLDEKHIIPRHILEGKSFNTIVYKLYNFIQDSSNSNQDLNNKYSSFQLTFREIHKIFIGSLNGSSVNEIMKYYLITNVEEGYLNLEQTITDIYYFINKENGNQFGSQEGFDKITKTEKILKFIKELNDDVISKYQSELYSYKSNKKQKENDSNDSKKTKNMVYKSFLKYKIDDFRPKRQNLDKKVVFRCIDLYLDLTLKSFEFLFKRYIRCLHPKFNYKVSVRFIQSDNKNVLSSDIIAIGRSIGLYGVNINGNIVFEIKRPDT